MNHLELFLNASTQMIFIVYASLSVLRGFHVSTFLKGWQEQPGQSRRQVHLAPCPPRRAPRGRKRLPLLLLDAHQNRGIRIPRAYLQLLQMILFMYYRCYSSAQTQPTSTRVLRRGCPRLEELTLQIRDHSTGCIGIFQMQIMSMFQRDVHSHRSTLTCTCTAP